MSKGVELYPHQTEALRRIKNGTVLTGGTGSGKTRTALAYYYLIVCGGKIQVNGVGHAEEMARPRNIVVITTAKKRDSKDWEAEAAHFRVTKDSDVSMSGVTLTVDSWNNIEEYLDVQDAFFVFDEQRAVGSGKWSKAFIAIAKRNLWIMLSATPGDTWLDYIPLFLANGLYKNRTAFVDAHVVFDYRGGFPKVKRYLGTGTLARHRARLLIPMPDQRHTVQHIHQRVVGHDAVLYATVADERWNPYEDRPVESTSEYFAAMRRVVNSDWSRLGEVLRIAEKHKRLIIFYNFDYELEILRTLGASTGRVTSEWNGHKHQETPTEESWFYLVQYTAGNEAWNCITTDAMIMYSLNYSWRVNEQCKGRIDRINTSYTDLHYYYLRSSAKIDDSIMKALATKKDFNEKEYLRAA